MCGFLPYQVPCGKVSKAAIDHLAAEAAEQHGQAHAKLARLLREVAENHPSLRDPV